MRAINKLPLFLVLALMGNAFGSIEMFNKNLERPEGSETETDPGNIEVKEVSFKCIKAGTVYKPNKDTTCVCTGFLQADCKPDNSSGSSTERPVGGSTQKPPTLAQHPLDPLTQDEIKKSTQIIESSAPVSSRKRAATTRFIYNWVTLKEPPKKDLLPYFISDTTPPRSAYVRKSFSVLIERATGNVYEAVVNLDNGQVESMTRVENVQPSLSPEDMLKAEEITRNDPNVRAKAAAEGYPDMNLVNADPWSMGYVGDQPQFVGKRLIQLYLYGKNSKDDNQYAHPLDFLVVVDMQALKVIAIEDLPTHQGFDATDKTGNTVPRTEANYDYKLRGGKGFLRRDDKPITVSSPEGPSYTITGNQVQWQKWKMRVGFNGREGMVIHTVSYNDNGKVRPVLYRASLSEMFIPYGDPRPPYHRKAVFDLGEYGIGFNADKQTQNEDVIGAVKFFDGVLNNSTGDPIRYQRIISIREEDAGILWKHVDYRTGEGVVVRSHRLVLSFIATVGNYEYIFLWMFYQDGSIQLQIQMSGILSLHLLAKNTEGTDWGTVEANQINAPFHQHFFACRLDTEIDGTNNSVHTTDAVPLPDDPSPTVNPYLQGFTINKTQLPTASEAKTKIAPLSGRVWVVDNPGSIHKYTGQPVGWKLMPMNSPPMMMAKDSPLHPKAAFLDYDVWVTPYAEDQLFAGGFYLNNSGLPVWVGNDPGASVANTDIVLWHSFGLTHIPRVEDYPVMPVESTGFWLKPYNFFLENPSIDVPPPGKIKKLEL